MHADKVFRSPSSALSDHPLLPLLPYCRVPLALGRQGPLMSPCLTVPEAGDAHPAPTLCSPSRAQGGPLGPWWQLQGTGQHPEPCRGGSPADCVWRLFPRWLQVLRLQPLSRPCRGASFSLAWGLAESRAGFCPVRTSLLVL